MINKKIKNILFVVAHPDDESLWVGGTLHFLSKFDFLNIHVICVTGSKDADRKKSFFKALDMCGVSSRAILNHDIPTKGGIPLQNIERLFFQGLKEINLNAEDLDLIITHSPYGDEHNHIQHSQLFHEINIIAKQRNIPFGFFSFFPMPYVGLIPTALYAKRQFQTHLLNFSVCFLTNKINIDFTPPVCFIQFKIDTKVKDNMLKCYNTINLEEHKKGYYAWDSSVESFYLLQEEGMNIFKKIVDEMTSPTKQSCFMEAQRK